MLFVLVLRAGAFGLKCLVGIQDISIGDEIEGQQLMHEETLMSQSLLRQGRIGDL
jgi:hypothetical protein